MALFMKQDFNPPILSRRWVAIKFRPNMVLNNRGNIIQILESGLLFREDSVEVEQEAPSPDEVRIAAGGKGWMTKGEKVAAVVGVAACVAVFPPKSLNRSTIINISAYVSIPLLVRWAHRSQCTGSLAALLQLMREYLALARRTAACLKEYQALHAHLGSLTTVIESTHTLLCRQQSSLSVLLSRASSAILGNIPWLQADVAWDAVHRDPDDNLMKIHHAFLVVQSTLLKHLAMAHYVPNPTAQRLYKNYNERIYWIHNVVIPHLTQEFKQNLESLERMYRLLKNSANKDSDVKKLGSAVNNNWLYSEIHTGVAKSCLEIKLTANKCNSLDVFLDSCAMNKQQIDLEVLNKDIDDIIEGLTKCLKTIQNSQLRLKKLQNKQEKEIIEVKCDLTVENAGILTIDDKVPESKDEVFYFVKTDDDEPPQTVSDVTTAPGKKERETSKIVFCELKRKLGKREDIMRERERQALAKTMPDLKDIPEFPRQISLDEFMERKGYIKKLNTKNFKNHRLSITKKLRNKVKKYRLKIAKYGNESDISGDVYEANAKLNVKSKLITISKDNIFYVTKWCKFAKSENSSSYKDVESSGLSDGESDMETGASKSNETVNNGIKFSKQELELSPSSSESDFEFCNDKNNSLLNDVRRHRVVRKKNYPNHRPYGSPSNHREAIDNDIVDEGLKPMEYTFGTGMAMASVLQLSKKINSTQEEVFIGDGELSTDSGNDEDA